MADVNWDILDHCIGARNVWLATFTTWAASTPTEIWSSDVACSLWACVDVAVFSFIERATFRFDVAKTINAATPWQFWFGISTRSDGAAKHSRSTHAS